MKLRVAVLAAAGAAALAVGAPAAQAAVAPSDPVPVQAGATWEQLKGLPVAEAIKYLSAEIQQKTTSHPLYGLLKNTKLEQLPAHLQEEIKATLTAM